MKTTIKLIFVRILPFLILPGLSGCKKLVEVNPPVTAITNASVYNSDATATSVLTGIYGHMASNSSTAGFDITKFAGLSADEIGVLSPTDNTVIGYYTNSLYSSGTGTEIWNSIYPQVIYTSNEAIAGISASTSLTPSIKKQLLGEAKFMRAFGYFYLTNFYGDVPLVLTTDYKQNQVASRTSQTLVYRQIVKDLQDAQNLLSDQFLDGTLLATSTERVRPTKWAATALLARVYLSTGDWANAEIQATTLISNTTLFGLSSFANSFLKASLGNNEAIWQLQPVVAVGGNPLDNTYFIPPATGMTINSPFLNPSLMNSFEAGDLRKTNWTDTTTVSGITYYFPFKYKVFAVGTPVNEYSMVLRLAEQYLIRAEARAHLNKLTGVGSAAEDINMIRNRAGLSPTAAITQADLLTAVYHERQVELFTEWGHRWLDLKRAGLVNSVMSVVTPQKGGTWSPSAQLYPIPLSDIKADPSLTQNPGY